LVGVRIGVSVGTGVGVPVGTGVAVSVGIGVGVSVGTGVAVSLLLFRVKVAVFKLSFTVPPGGFPAAKADGVSSSASRALKATSTSAKTRAITPGAKDTLLIISCFTVTPAYFQQPLQDISRRGNPSLLHVRRLHPLPSIMEEWGRQEKGDLVEIWLRYSYDGMLSPDVCCTLSDKLVGLRMMAERAQDNLRRYNARQPLVATSSPI